MDAVILLGLFVALLAIWKEVDAYFVRIEKREDKD